MFKDKSIYFFMTIAVVATMLLARGLVYATWVGPPDSPPACPVDNPGCNPPVNVGSGTQYKAGAFGVGGFFSADSGMSVMGGNVGIGMATPDGKLHVHTSTAGAVTANANADDLVVEIGSAEGGMSILTSNNQVGGIYFGDTDDNDIGRIDYNHVQNSMGFYTNNGVRMTINSSGNVGIGTTNPAATFHSLRATNGWAGIFYNSDAGGEGVSIGGAATDSTVLLRIESNAGATSVLEVEANGKVGIGTESPQEPLHVGGSGNSTKATIRNTNSANGAELEFNVTGGATWQIGTGRDSLSGNDTNFHLYGGTPGIVMVADASGNVGIGTTNPGYIVDVEQNYGTAFDPAVPSTYGATINIHNPSDTAATGSTLLFTHRSSSTGYAGITSLSAGADKADLLFFTRNNTGGSPSANSIMERMRITDAGNVGIGTTTPWRTFSSEGTAGFSSGLTTGTGQALNIDSTTFEILRNTSSRRYKDNITEIEIDSSKIYELKPSSFTWNETTGNSGMRDFGLIAEEVYEILPELVWLNSSSTPEAVRYDMLSVLNLKAIQEQQMVIESLQAGGQTIIESQSNTEGGFISQGIDWFLAQLETFGVKIVKNIAYFKEIVAEKFVGYKAVLDALEMKDSVTGEIYCVRINQGEWEKFKGTCGEKSVSAETDNNQLSTSNVQTSDVETTFDDETSTTTPEVVVTTIPEIIIEEVFGVSTTTPSDSMNEIEVEVEVENVVEQNQEEDITVEDIEIIATTTPEITTEIASTTPLEF